MPDLLLTAFEPFEGRQANESERTARELARVLEARGGWRVELHVLPVEFDRAAARVADALNASGLRPDLAVSLGEGTCPLRLETAAHNRDHGPGRRDNAGVERVDHLILAGQPATVGFTLPMDRMYAAFPAEERAEVFVSESPGGYVCNNTAFHLACHFRRMGVPYGFIHVPSLSWERHSPRTAEVNAERIARMLEASAPWVSPALPTSAAESREREASAPDPVTREFFARLHARWLEREKGVVSTADAR